MAAISLGHSVESEIGALPCARAGPLMADAMTSQNPAHLCPRNLDRIASSPRQSIERPQACVGDTAAARGAHNPFLLSFGRSQQVFIGWQAVAAIFMEHSSTIDVLRASTVEENNHVRLGLNLPDRCADSRRPRLRRDRWIRG